MKSYEEQFIEIAKTINNGEFEFLEIESEVCILTKTKRAIAENLYYSDYRASSFRYIGEHNVYELTCTPTNDIYDNSVFDNQKVIKDGVILFIKKEDKVDQLLLKAIYGDSNLLLIVVSEQYDTISTRPFMSDDISKDSIYRAINIGGLNGYNKN